MKEPMHEGVPMCSTPAQFDGWRHWARIAPPGPLGFCEDCTRQYQNEMRRQDRCKHPEVVPEDKQ